MSQHIDHNKSIAEVGSQAGMSKEQNAFRVSLYRAQKKGLEHEPDMDAWLAARSAEREAQDSKRKIKGAFLKSQYRAQQKGLEHAPDVDAWSSARSAKKREASTLHQEGDRKRKAVERAPQRAAKLKPISQVEWGGERVV